MILPGVTARDGSSVETQHFVRTTKTEGVVRGWHIHTTGSQASGVQRMMRLRLGEVRLSIAEDEPQEGDDGFGALCAKIQAAIDAGEEFVVR